jgi:hypothetical protein
VTPYLVNAVQDALSADNSGSFFIDDGAENNWDGATNGVPAIYVSGVSQTWFFNAAYRPSYGVNKKVVEVRTYGASGWSDDYPVAANTLNTDPHDVPAAAYHAASGTVYVFYGAHDSAAQYAQTANAHDPSRWLLGRLVTGTYGNMTFLKPFVIGNTLYVFWSGPGIGTGVQEALKYTTAAINAATGALTWSGTVKSMVDVATGGTDGWLLPGEAMIDPANPTTILFSFNYGTSRGVYPIQNVYVVRFNSATLAISNLGGGTSIAVGSQPATKAQLDSNFKAFTSTDTNIPAMSVDSAGDIHIVTADMSTTPDTLVHIKGSGATWTPTTIFTYNAPYTAGGGAVVPNTDGSVDVYFCDGTAGYTLYAMGSGAIRKLRRNPAGAWSVQSLVLSIGARAYNAPQVVRNSTHAKVLFSETTPDGETNSGALKGFAYTGSGYVQRRSPFVLRDGLASFDPVASRAGFAYSNNNLTVADAVGGARRVALIPALATAGLLCWEVKCLGRIGGNTEIGFVRAGHDNTAYLGGPAGDSFGDFGGTDNASFGELFQFSTSEWGVNDVIRCALNLNTGKFWMQVNELGWSGGSGAQAIGLQNPATGLGGMNVSSVTSGFAIAPAVSVHDIGDIFTIRLSDADFEFAKPAGFSDFSFVQGNDS